MPEDAYGAMIFMMAAAWTSGLAKPKDKDVSIMIVTFLVYVLNVALQAWMIWWTWNFIVRTSVVRAQSKFDSMLQSFEKNQDTKLFTVDMADWYNADTSTKDALCQVPTLQAGFFGGVLFLWMTSMVSEFRDVFRLWINVYECQGISFLVGKKPQVIHSIPRACIVLLVLLPKLLICSCLGWIGCIWLTATLSFPDLLLNAVALEFVLGIDEKLYTTFLPARFRDRLHDSKFVIHRAQNIGETVTRDGDMPVRQHSSVFFLFRLGGAVLCAWGFGKVMQPVLPALNLARQCALLPGAASPLVCDALLPGMPGTGTSECWNQRALEDKVVNCSSDQLSFPEKQECCFFDQHYCIQLLGTKESRPCSDAVLNVRTWTTVGANDTQLQPWCCENLGSGCQNYSTTFPDCTGLPDAMQFGEREWCCLAGHKNLCPFHCSSGLANFDEWTAQKKKWCCNGQQGVWSARCPPRMFVVGGVQDCLRGFANWEVEWSEMKKRWCCKTEQKACPFECDAEGAWSELQKAWCCLKHDKGCYADGERAALKK
ncbi:unnamed protein product [Polarella glacialis]|uniref:Uncharacterized protein n=1 Tax=Polarella glacialis TaxID=89957 RepID=A0A813KY18_POLGL|nr:unnamed protein product [Polarella glacialis]